MIWESERTYDMEFAGFFKSIFRAFNGKNVKATIGVIDDISTKALPYVTAIAAMTPNRSDDEIAAAYQKYAVPFLAASKLADSASARGVALRDLVVVILRRNGLDQPAHILNAAVDIAVALHKVE